MATEDQKETLPETQEPVPEETKPKEVTKRTIRLKVWQTIQEQKLSPRKRFMVYNTIPTFLGAQEAAKLLAETDEFKKANSIKVNIDLAQEPVKMEVVKANKTLFVPPAQKSPNVYAKIKNCNVEELDLVTQKKIIKLQGGEDTYDEISIENIVPLDMVVVGSCAVSRLGHRIGKGNGYVDLDVGMLISLGVITKDTLLVTTVHDVQVHDTLPEELFQTYDLPLDMIVTPTEVIRVSKRLPRPTGIQWNILSSRRLEIAPVLKEIKEREEKAGKVIELKAEDTDVESYHKKSKQRKSFRRNPSEFRRRRRSDRQLSETQQNGGADSHEEGGEKTDEDGGGDSKQRSGRTRKYFRRNVRRPPRSAGNKEGGGESGAEKSEGDEKKNGGGRPRKEKPPADEVCIRIVNFTPPMQVNDLKQELKNRDLNPRSLTWNFNFNRAYLVFPKNPDQSDADTAADLLKQLENLTITKKEEDGETQEVQLQCEYHVRKPYAGRQNKGRKKPRAPNNNKTVLEGSRIETTNVTSV